MLYNLQDFKSDLKICNLYIRYLKHVYYKNKAYLYNLCSSITRLTYYNFFISLIKTSMSLVLMNHSLVILMVIIIIFLTVMWIRIRIQSDPHHFGLPDPGSKKSAKIMGNSYKNRQKSP